MAPPTLSSGQQLKQSRLTGELPGRLVRLARRLSAHARRPARWTGRWLHSCSCLFREDNYYLTLRRLVHLCDNILRYATLVKIIWFNCARLKPSLRVPRASENAACWLVGRPVGWSVGRSVGQPAGQVRMAAGGVGRTSGSFGAHSAAPLEQPTSGPPSCIAGQPAAGEPTRSCELAPLPAAYRQQSAGPLGAPDGLAACARQPRGRTGEAAQLRQSVRPSVRPSVCVCVCLRAGPPERGPGERGGHAQLQWAKGWLARLPLARLAGRNSAAQVGRQKGAYKRATGGRPRGEGAKFKPSRPLVAALAKKCARRVNHSSVNFNCHPAGLFALRLKTRPLAQMQQQSLVTGASAGR